MYINVLLYDEVILANAARNVFASVDDYYFNHITRVDKFTVSERIKGKYVL